MGCLLFLQLPGNSYKMANVEFCILNAPTVVHEASNGTRMTQKKTDFKDQYIIGSGLPLFLEQCPNRPLIL